MRWDPKTNWWSSTNAYSCSWTYNILMAVINHFIYSMYTRYVAVININEGQTYMTLAFFSQFFWICDVVLTKVSSKHFQKLVMFRNLVETTFPKCVIEIAMFRNKAVWYVIIYATFLLQFSLYTLTSKQYWFNSISSKCIVDLNILIQIKSMASVFPFFHLYYTWYYIE